ncbi:hypothetical protein JIG36_05065 [Actinoplanes sp. LDG1-06]|uniref:Uncharacterized protein n=1 Tax=Paractinoplanes ovalisporus TaxID=2810368 RepID=A0ABS2A513_9ACTN|nr:hypothetical protein [Actinoplanes ovalisporus]MBM2614928.1 hypothetical protein [Actinoplanes ovalisporus]
MTLDDQLRRHDPARHVPDDLARSPHALATLARVTATEPGTGSPAVSYRPPRRRAFRYAMAAAVATAGVAVSAPILGDDQAAVATWDAQPKPASAQDAARYTKDCSQWTGIRTGTAQMVEVRGIWVMTYLSTADGDAQCLRSTRPTAESPDGEGQASYGPALPAPAADALSTVGVMETSGGVTATQFLIAGKAGADVTGVVFHAEDMDIRATVRNGHFAAWWPQRKPSSIVGRMVENTGYSGSPNPDVTITLKSGRSFTTEIKDYDTNQ